MGDLMCDHEPARLGRCEDEPPIEANPAAAAAAAPAGACVADGHRRGPAPGAAGNFGCLARQGIDRPPLQELLDSAGESLLRATAHQLALAECGHTRFCLDPAKLDLFPLDRDPCSGHEWLGRQRAPELLVDPAALGRCPGQSGRGADPDRVCKLQVPLPLVETQPHPPRRPDRVQQHRHWQVGMADEPLRAHAPPRGIRGLRRRLR